MILRYWQCPVCVGERITRRFQLRSALIDHLILRHAYSREAANAVEKTEIYITRADALDQQRQLQ